MFSAMIWSDCFLLGGAFADDKPKANPEKEIKAALVELSDADRTVAELQRFCPVSGERLGSEGKPLQLAVDGKPVFVCCEDCKAKVLADPKATLAKVEHMKKINAALAKLSVTDRAEAESQKFCAIQNKNELGSMGMPVKLTIEGSTVFLCCDSCKAKVTANPKGTLQAVAKLKADHEKAAH
jgi:YHS domain-containing protein